MKLKQLIFSTIDNKEEEAKRHIALKYKVENLKDELKVTELALLDDPNLKEKGITNSEKRKQYVTGETMEDRAELQDVRMERDLSQVRVTALNDRLTFLQSIFDFEGDSDSLEEEE